MTTTFSEAESVRPQPSAQDARAELSVQGMTCATCVRHVEEALGRTEGVKTASVNFALARATVVYDPTRTNEDALAAAVTRAGYEVPRAPRAEDSRFAEPTAEERAHAVEQAEQRDERSIRRDFLVAAVLSIPLFVLAMSHGAIPGTEGPVGRWLQFALATPVVLGPGRRFFRLAWAALRRRAADMNTLVSLGAGAAFSYSTVALVAPGLFPHAAHGMVPHLYFEAAAAILTFVLLGKLLEMRAKKRLADAVRGLAALQPKTAQRLRDGAEEEIAVEEVSPAEVSRL